MGKRKSSTTKEIGEPRKTSKKVKKTEDILNEEEEQDEDNIMNSVCLVFLLTPVTSFTTQF